MRPRFLCIFLCLEHKLDELELLFAGSPQKKKKMMNFDCSGKKCSLNRQRSLEEEWSCKLCMFHEHPLFYFVRTVLKLVQIGQQLESFSFLFLSALKKCFLYVLCLSSPIFFSFSPYSPSTLCQSDVFFPPLQIKFLL